MTASDDVKVHFLKYVNRSSGVTSTSTYVHTNGSDRFNVERQLNYSKKETLTNYLKFYLLYKILYFALYKYVIEMKFEKK